ncbi:MAG: polysaccharide biosynthesis/export family protein [Candidatus Eisenbacteria bacterium]
MKQSIAILLACLALAAGCGGSKPEPVLDAPVERAEIEVGVLEREPYTIVAGDVLTLRFFYYPQHNVEVMVRPDGIVTIPLVGEVMAEGMKPLEIEAIVRARYAEILAEPEVTVLVSEFADQTVFVLGEVSKPGAYPLKGSMTLVDAIARAGGFTVNGKAGSVILMRRNGSGEYSGRKVDLNSVISAEGTERIHLMARDVVFVPMTAIAKVDLFVEQYFKKLSPALLFYLYGYDVWARKGGVIVRD